MAISSLESLIAKYGSNFGVTSQIPAEAQAKAAANARSSETESAAVKKDDTVKLSQAALDYQKAHTLPTGTFMPPNLFGDMLGAFDNASDGTANAGTGSLMDFLGAGTEGNSADPNSAADPTGYFDNLGRLMGKSGPTLPAKKT